MEKFRIIRIEEYSDGVKKEWFIIQERFFIFFWCTLCFYRPFSMSWEDYTFKTIDKAKEFISSEESYYKHEEIVS